jgi:hypothetical protein
VHAPPRRHSCTPQRNPSRYLCPLQLAVPCADTHHARVHALHSHARVHPHACVHVCFGESGRSFTPERWQCAGGPRPEGCGGCEGCDGIGSAHDARRVARTFPRGLPRYGHRRCGCRHRSFVLRMRLGWSPLREPRVRSKRPACVPACAGVVRPMKHRRRVVSPPRRDAILPVRRGLMDGLRQARARSTRPSSSRPSPTQAPLAAVALWLNSASHCTLSAPALRRGPYVERTVR